VPALIVGPRVPRMILHEPARIAGAEERDQPQFDHTTLIKTILLAFADNPATKLRKMPARVQRAPSLGSLLLDAPRTDLDDPRSARDLMERWRTDARQRREAAPAEDDTSAAPGRGTRSAAPDGAGHPLVLTDFQVAWQKFAGGMRKLGLDV
jgi:hypothetical protein